MPKLETDHGERRSGRRPLGESLSKVLDEVRRLPLTTRGRLTLAAAAILAVALAIADVGTYFALGFVQSTEADNQLRAQAMRVASGLQLTDGRITYGGDGLPQETPDGIAVDLAVVGTDGVLATTPSQPFSQSTVEDLGRPALRSRQVIWVETTSAGEPRRVYVTPLPGKLGQDLVLVASTSLAEVRGSIARAMVLVVIVSVLLLATGTGLVYSLLGRALRPVRRIARLADTLSERDLHRRVDVQAPDDELGELVRTFNRMLARLESSFNTLRAFTADASHELRSPLALMGTELEVSLSRPVSSDEYRRVLRLLQSEVQHMTGVVERLLLLARADAGQLQPRREALDVADFLHEAYGRWLARASQEGVELQVAAPDSGAVRADLDLTRRIIDNLVENALRHSPKGGLVRLSASANGEGWLFEVADRGPGVPDGQRDRIFDRFARGDTARTPDSEGGTGLGLPLSAAFARAQGGEVRLVARPGWGAVFEVWLPN
jgi:two-component system, OmpR family, heavy metal sensor histidine kinase CusS